MIFMNSTFKYKSEKVNEAIAALNAAYKNLESNYTMRYWFQDETFDNLYETETLAAKLNLAFCIVSFVVAIIGILGLATFNSMRKNTIETVRNSHFNAVEFALDSITLPVPFIG